MHLRKFRFPKLIGVFLLLLFAGWFHSETRAAGTSPGFDLKGDVVTLQKAVDLAIEHNPELKSGRKPRILPDRAYSTVFMRLRPRFN